MDAWAAEAGQPLALVEKRHGRSFLGLSWGEIKLLSLAGVGFFLDAFDLFVINMVRLKSSRRSELSSLTHLFSSSPDRFMPSFW